MSMRLTDLDEIRRRRFFEENVYMENYFPHQTHVSSFSTLKSLFRITSFEIEMFFLNCDQMTSYRNSRTERKESFFCD